MAITLEANYQKRLGLPNFSSHAYSVTVRTEVSNLSKIDEASAHLYRQLQAAVDRDIQETGFLPGASESQQERGAPYTGNGNNRARPPANERAASEWNCSDKQRGLIEKLMDEHKIPFEEVDRLARDRFRNGLKDLNKMQASGLIDEMFDTYRSKPASRSYGRGGRS